LSKEPTISSRRIYEGCILNLRVDTVRLTSGRTTEREIVEHGDCVAVVAIDDEDNVLLVRQFRKPAERDLLEIPAGGIEPGEDPAACVQRELGEETGYAAGQLQRIGGFYSSPGFCTEYMHLYLAMGLRPRALAPEEDESIEVIKVPLSRALEMIEANEICDAKSIAGLLMVQALRRGDRISGKAVERKQIAC